ncbi:hypothetical protein ACWEPI_21470 [Streptomyces sp. NPDC004262]
MPEYIDNPAGRLRNLLIEVHRASPNQNVSAWQAVTKVLVPRAAPASAMVMSAMSHLLELPSEIRAAVAALNEDEEEKEYLLEHLGKIEVFLTSVANQTMVLQQAFQVFAVGGDVPNSAAVQSLSHCSRRLHRLRPEPTIPSEEIDELIQSVTELMSDIRGSGLEAAAKALLLRHLHLLLQALDLIRITGTAPVEESLDAFLVALQRAPEVAEGVRRRGFGERLEAIAKVIRTAMSLARGAHQLGTETHAVLEQGAHAIDQASHLLQ